MFYAGAASGGGRSGDFGHLKRDIAAVAHDLRADQLIESLPAEFREVLVLRELNDLSYREIAQVTEAPVGTVISRLARA